MLVVVQRQVPMVPRYAALVVDNGGVAGFAGSNAPRAVLAFPLCSLVVGRPLVLAVVAISQVQFLDKVNNVFLSGAVVQTVHAVWRRRSCSSSSRTLTSLSWRRLPRGPVIEILLVAVHLVVGHRCSSWLWTSLCSCSDKFV